MSSEPVDIFSKPGLSDGVLLRLHVAGDAPNSVKAHANLVKALKEHPDLNCKLEIVDCLSDPERSIEDGVLVTPTLIRVSPEPKVRVVGDLRNYDDLAHVLGLDKKIKED